jgi:hypothetical protein
MTKDTIQITKEEARLLNWYNGIESVKQDIETAIAKRKDLGHTAIVEVHQKELLAMNSLKNKILTHLFPEDNDEE